MEDNGEQRGLGKWHECKKFMCLICAVLGYAMPVAGLVGGICFGSWLASGFKNKAIEIISAVIFGLGFGWASGLVGFVWYVLFMKMEIQLCREDPDYYE